VTPAFYAAFIPGRPASERLFTPGGLEPRPLKERFVMDILLIVLGVGLFAAMIAYAVLLGRL
jgi:hypothetical protein